MIKQAFNVCKSVYFGLLFILLTSCSSETGGESNIIINGPNTIEITAKHEEFTVQFSKIAGIGAENSNVLPYFEFYINTKDDVASAENIGKVQQMDDGSGLMRQLIKPSKTESDGKNIVLEYPLKDGTEYYVWVRACYENYGCSGYTMTKATPVPYPSKLTSNDVEVYGGDKTIFIKIKNKNKFDEYGILADSDCNNPNLQRFTPKYNTASDNYLISSLNNNQAYPVCIRAQNINTDISNPETISWLQLGNITPKASPNAPKAPQISIIDEGHKRVTIGFNGEFQGDYAVSEYEVEYYKNQESPVKEKIVTDSENIEHTILQLTNGQKYNISVTATNSIGRTKSNTVTATPKESIVDLDNLDTVLGKTAGTYIFAEDVPHSDFWRIDEKYTKGGRPSTDRLVRGKETALGNLYSDAVQYYVTTILNKNVDFTVLAGEMITNGMVNNLSITPRILMGLTEINYINDPIVILEIEGKYLINENDYNIDLNNYPSLGVSDTATSLFGQAAAVYRNGHYGTGGGTSYGTKAWLMPSKEARYTIEYLPYSLDEFQANFQNKCGRVEDNADYDVINDPKKCYLLNYYDVVGYESPKEGYRRGRIKSGSLFINGKQIEPDKIYKIATTKKLADTMYTAFLNAKSIENTGVIFWKAVAYYINEQGKITPYLDGRVKLTGGVPGNTANDFK